MVTRGGLWRLSCLALVLATSGAVWAVAAEGSSAVSRSSLGYDELMRSPVAKRTAIFRTLSPRNKAEIVRTHMERWRDAHAEGLSQAQKDVLADSLALVGPELYLEPVSLPLRVKADQLFRRAQALFSEEQLSALFAFGTYVPPPAPKPTP